MFYYKFHVCNEIWMPSSFWKPNGLQMVIEGDVALGLRVFPGLGGQQAEFQAVAFYLFPRAVTAFIPCDGSLISFGAGKIPVCVGER